MRMNAIGIVCRNLKESIDFYQDFGLVFEKTSDNHYEARTREGLRLMLDSLDLIKKINPEWSMSSSSNIILCFEMDGPDKVDGQIERLKKNHRKIQIVKEPWDAFWSQRYSTVKDPDGNLIDIFSNL